MAIFWDDFIERSGVTDSTKKSLISTYIANFQASTKGTTFTNAVSLNGSDLLLNEIKILNKVNTDSITLWSDMTTIPAAGVTGVKQVSTTTLTGTSGTANITVNGVAYLATFATSLTLTATNFVTAHAAALLTAGVVVTANTGVLTFTARGRGVVFTISNAVMATGDLAGTTVATTAAVKGTMTTDTITINTLNITSKTSLQDVLDNHMDTIITKVAEAINAKITAITGASGLVEIAYYNILGSISLVSDGLNKPYLVVKTNCDVKVVGA